MGGSLGRELGGWGCLSLDAWVSWGEAGTPSCPTGWGMPRSLGSKGWGVRDPPRTSGTPPGHLGPHRASNHGISLDEIPAERRKKLEKARPGQVLK